MMIIIENLILKNAEVHQPDSCYAFRKCSYVGAFQEKGGHMQLKKSKSTETATYEPKP